MSYFVGALLAVLAGAVFNLGILVQKKAVNALPPGTAGMMGLLLRDKVWLAGLALQFLIGTPMYAVAQLFIGPTLIPGLMATGLIVLALGSPLVAGERLRAMDFVAVGIVVAAVALFGLSRLSVDLAGFALPGGGLIRRFAVATGALTALALLLLLAARPLVSRRGPLTILASGLVYSLGNLWLGLFMTALARFTRGERGLDLIAIGSAALLVVIVTNVLSLVWMQNAFRHGKAAALVPLQQVPVQIVPALSYFVVFLQSSPAPASPYLAAAGVLLIVAGSAILGAGPASSTSGAPPEEPRSAAGA